MVYIRLSGAVVGTAGSAVAALRYRCSPSAFCSLHRCWAASLCLRKHRREHRHRTSACGRFLLVRALSGWVAVTVWLKRRRLPRRRARLRVEERIADRGRGLRTPTRRSRSQPRTDSGSVGKTVPTRRTLVRYQNANREDLAALSKPAPRRQTPPGQLGRCIRQHPTMGCGGFLPVRALSGWVAVTLWLKRRRPPRQRARLRVEERTAGHAHGSRTPTRRSRSQPLTNSGPVGQTVPARRTLARFPHANREDLAALSKPAPRRQIPGCQPGRCISQRQAMAHGACRLAQPLQRLPSPPLVPRLRRMPQLHVKLKGADPTAEPSHGSRTPTHLS